MYFDVTFHL